MEGWPDATKISGEKIGWENTLSYEFYIIVINIGIKNI